MLMNAEDFIETRRTSQEVPGSLSTQPGWPSEGSTARLLTVQNRGFVTGFVIGSPRDFLDFDSDFDLDFDLDLDFGFGFDLILAGFGLIWIWIRFDFDSILAAISL